VPFPCALSRMLAWTCIRHALSFGANIFKRHNSVTVSGLRPPLPALAARCYQKLDAIKGGSFFFGAFFFGLRRDAAPRRVSEAEMCRKTEPRGCEHRHKGRFFLSSLLLFSARRVDASGDVAPPATITPWKMRANKLTGSDVEMTRQKTPARPEMRFLRDG